MDIAQGDVPTVVLLGGISDRQLLACIRSLESGRIEHVICPPKNEKMTSWELTKYRDKITSIEYISPVESAEGFINSVEELINKYGSVVIFPFGEPTHKYLSKISSKMPDNSSLAMSDYTKLKQLDDKLSLCKNASKHNIRHPEIYKQLPDKSEIPFVQIMKPPGFEGYDQVKLVKNHNHYLQVSDSIEKTEKEVFYQEYVPGVSYWYGAVSLDGDIIRDVTQKTVIQQPAGGSTIMARPAEMPSDLRNNFANLIEEIGWTGPLVAEFRFDGDDWYIIEVNPRFWGPLQLAVDNNVQFPVDLYNIYNDISVCADKEKNNIGYFRIDALFNGIWKRLLTNTPFQYNWESEDKSYYYRPVWARRDTYKIFLQKFFNSAISDPAHYTFQAIKSPKKAEEKLRTLVQDLRERRI